MARILVAERNKALRSLLETAIRRTGHQVESVATGDDALVHLGTAPFDCILVGAPLSLHVGKPSTFLEYLEESAADVAPRVVVLTTSTFDKALLSRAIRLGVCAIVHEPFDINELTATVELCVRKQPPARRLIGFPTSAIEALERSAGKVRW